jgi:hypothetical protein
MTSNPTSTVTLIFEPHSQFPQYLVNARLGFATAVAVVIGR